MWVSEVPTYQQRDFLTEYLSIASASLALIRANECFELSRLKFPRPILDVGCGDGLFASQLFSEPLEAGIDLDAAEVSRAQRSGMYLEAKVASATAIPFPDESFATVFSNGVLEHIPALIDALSEIARVLQPGGQLIATTPCAHFSAYIALPSLANRFWAHWNVLEPEGWAPHLEAVGLRLIRSSHYNSEAAIHAHQRLMPLSIGSWVIRRTTGRWVASSALRRSFVAPVLAKMLRQYYAASVAEGGSIIWIAEKQ